MKKKDLLIKAREFELPEKIVKRIDSAKRKDFVKKAKKDLSEFYNNDTFNLILSAIAEDEKIVLDIEKAVIRPNYSGRLARSTVPTDFGKSLENLNFFNLLRELKSQEETYKLFPEVFSAAGLLTKYNQFAAAILALRPRVEGAFRKASLKANYAKEIAELQGFLKSYTTVVSLLS